MKSVIKRSLFIGISLALAALTARRLCEETEIQGRLDEPAVPPPPQLGPKVGNEAPGPLPGMSAKTMVAPTVTFSGRVVRNGPSFALRETAGVLYPLDLPGRARPFEGADVRVTGKLDLDTRLLYVDAIEQAVL